MLLGSSSPATTLQLQRSRAGSWVQARRRHPSSNCHSQHPTHTVTLYPTCYPTSLFVGSRDLSPGEPAQVSSRDVGMSGDCLTLLFTLNTGEPLITCSNFLGFHTPLLFCRGLSGVKHVSQHLMPAEIEALIAQLFGEDEPDDDDDAPNPVESMPMPVDGVSGLFLAKGWLSAEKQVGR